MRLRSTTRLPGRYREDEVPEIPGTASFVHPTVPYNPNLPPAVFPTLDYPRPTDVQTTEVMAVPSRPDSPESNPEQEAPTKRATVFHGRQKSSIQWLKSRPSSDAESEEVEVSEPDISRLLEWDVLDENITEPGEYDGWGVMANDDGNNDSPRIGLSGYETAETWSRVTDGLKLVITMELTAVYSFGDAMKKLMMTEKEQNELVDLYEREIIRQAEEEEKIVQNQARQLQILMSRGPKISREEASASFEDLYDDVEDPPTFMIRRTDVTCAQRFLRSMKLQECADRLWQYEGVAQPLIAWNGFPKTNESSSATESTVLEDKRRALKPLENTTTSSLSNEKTSNAAMLRKVDALLAGAKPVKRRRVERRPISSKLPSGLRNSISGNDLEEAVASGPPALQAAFSPHKRPAPPRLRHSVKDTKPVTPRFRLVRKYSAQPSILQTSAFKPYNPLEHTPDSPTTKEQTYSWLAGQVEPYTPLPSTAEETPPPLSTPSRVPKVQLDLSKKRFSPLTSPSPMAKVRLTPAQVRLAQIDNILGRKADVATEPVTPDKGYAIPIAAPIGAPPETLSGKARSALKHADVELTPGNRRVANDARKAAEPIHKQDGKVNGFLVPTAGLQSESIATAPRQKKRKFLGEDASAYGASGHRRPRIQEQNEGSAKALGQKRRKIQDCEKGVEQRSVDKENKDNDITGAALNAAAISQFTATKVSVSEASAARFKGVKLLEQIMNVPAVKMSNPMNERKLEARKKTAGQMHKTAQDHDDDPDF